MKLCGEVGVGVGGGLDVGLSQSVGDTDLTVSLVAEASAKVGLIKTTANYELPRGVGIGHCTQANGKFERIVVSNKIVGYDFYGGEYTEVYTVVTDANNNVVTAFPGIPQPH